MGTFPLGLKIYLEYIQVLCWLCACFCPELAAGLGHYRALPSKAEYHCNDDSKIINIAVKHEITCSAKPSFPPRLDPSRPGVAFPTRASLDCDTTARRHRMFSPAGPDSSCTVVVEGFRASCRVRRCHHCSRPRRRPLLITPGQYGSEDPRLRLHTTPPCLH